MNLKKLTGLIITSQLLIGCINDGRSGLGVPFASIPRDSNTDSTQTNNTDDADSGLKNALGDSKSSMDRCATQPQSVFSDFEDPRLPTSGHYEVCAAKQSQFSILIHGSLPETFDTQNDMLCVFPMHTFEGQSNEQTNHSNFLTYFPNHQGLPVHQCFAISENSTDGIIATFENVVFDTKVYNSVIILPSNAQNQAQLQQMISLLIGQTTEAPPYAYGTFRN